MVTLCKVQYCTKQFLLQFMVEQIAGKIFNLWIKAPNMACWFLIQYLNRKYHCPFRFRPFSNFCRDFQNGVILHNVHLFFLFICHCATLILFEITNKIV